jgi:UDP-N-acetylmuramyl pentapeptide synthase
VGYDNVVVTEEGTEFALLHDGTEQKVRLRAVGSFQAQNAAAAALVAARLGMTWREIVDALEATEPVLHRFNVHRFKRGLTIVDDSYSAGYHALIHGTETAVRLAGKRRKVAFTSMMTSLGEYGTTYHRLAGEHLARCGFDEVVIQGTDSDSLAMRRGVLAGGLPESKVHVIPSPSDIAPTIATYALPDTLIYCKMHYYIRASDEVAKVFRALRDAGF